MDKSLKGNILLISHHLGTGQCSKLTNEIIDKTNLNPILLVLSREKINECNEKYYVPKKYIYSLEDFLTNESFLKFNINDIYEKFPQINWSKVIASERSFSDYSFLMGGTGNRMESFDYIENLTLNIISFFSEFIESYSPKAIISSYGDNLFNNIINIIAEQKKIKLFLPHFAVHSFNNSKNSGYIANTYYLESFDMVEKYIKLRSKKLSNKEIDKAEQIKSIILNTDHKDLITKVFNYSDSPLSGNLKNIIPYLLKNHRLNKNVDFYKISLIRKSLANIKRYFRNKSVKIFLSNQREKLPDKFIFYPLHFQPEASTLVGGIWYCNQISLIETLSKSVPFGYKIVVKEHMRGIGYRPLWQYKHLKSLYNVQFSNLDSKSIMKKAALAVSISGTIGIECLAMKKPVIMLGRNFHTYNDLYYRADNPEELESLFKKILMNNDFYKKKNLDEEIAKFLLSYFESLFDFHPWGNPDSTKKLLPYLLRELVKVRDQEEEFIFKKFNKKF